MNNLVYQLSLALSDLEPVLTTFPQTRYQGSKLKLTDWLEQTFECLAFDTVLDAFGGTGAVSYLLKKMDKSVTYNDILKFNYHIGAALIENSGTTLSDDEIKFLVKRHTGIKYPTFIQDNFHDIYFTDEENAWLDVVTTNIGQLEDKDEWKYKKAIAIFALAQAAIIKRPFNLFHRKNLYIRTANVERSFGNKTTWEKPFEDYFWNFVYEANQSVFCNNRKNAALNYDASEVPGHYDLVYIDPPYISPSGVGTDYLDFYHFLEGLTNYSNWHQKINYKTKHRKWKDKKSVWADKKGIYKAFDLLFERFRNSTLVVSYRSPGIPSREELIQLLQRHKGNVVEVNEMNYQYVLSSGKTTELLLIAK